MSSINRQSGNAAWQSSVWIEKYERGENMDGFADWIASSSENSDEFLKMARMVRLMQTPELVKQFDVDAAVAEAQAYQREERQRQVASVKRWSMAAAVAGLLVLGGGVLWRFDMADPWERYTTLYEPAREVTLDDGSQLRMETASTLLVLMDEKQRVIDLKAGEVFFRVQKDEHRRPFVVFVPRARIEVTGTEFRVQRHGLESVVQVEDGEVKIIATEHAQETRTVSKGQEVVIRHDGGIVEIGATPESAAPAQPAVVPSPAADEGRSRTLGEIVDEFNAANRSMQFVVDDAARHEMLYVDFPATEPEKLRRVLESEPGLEVTQDGVTVVVRKRE